MYDHRQTDARHALSIRGVMPTMYIDFYFDSYFKMQSFKEIYIFTLGYILEGKKPTYYLTKFV
jgi:hypothetical protein